MSRPTVFQRSRQLRRLLESEGYSGVATRLRQRLAGSISPPDSERLPLIRGDLVRAAEIASTGWKLPPPLPTRADEPLEIAWLCVPQGEGAGGFTTISRLVSSLEQAGHRCTFY